MPSEKLEATVLAGIEYFEREDLYEYIYECCNALAEKISNKASMPKQVHTSININNVILIGYITIIFTPFKIIINNI